MSVVHNLNRWGLAGLVVALSVASLIFASVPHVTGTPTGSYFDHIVILAMENQNYADVFGDGTTSGCLSGPNGVSFLCSLLPLSSTIPNYHSYCNGSSDPACSGGNTGGNPPCSYACYTLATSGLSFANAPSDGAGTAIGSPNLFDSLTNAGLSWSEYCESGCPRGADHSPCLQYTDTANSPNCHILSGALIGNSQVVTTTSNYVWITPTDGHNMHDNSVSSGDAWLHSFLVGSGSLASPAAGSLLASSLFTNTSLHTLLWIWWDEYDPSPNLEYGSMVKKGFVSQSNSWDHYSLLRMVENNWGLPTLSLDAQAPSITDIFGTITPPGLSASFTYSPSAPLAGSTVTFSGVASGGASPYSYNWTFGDGSAGSGQAASHTYSAPGTYSVNLTATDSASHSASSAQAVVVPTGQQPPVMIGWGGTRLDGATLNSQYPCSGCYKNTTFAASNVFPGQTQSDMERLVVRMQAMGFNTIRVSFAPYCSNPAGSGIDDSPYNLTDAQNMIKVANYYHFWIILRYDGENDISTQTACWTGYWKTLITQVGPMYSQIVWEPINEPSASVATLSTDYQLWINMARSTGDTHFVAIENQCASSCPFSGSNIWQGYPTVKDPLGKVLISFHKYYFVAYNTWTVSAAISAAQSDYQATILGEQNTGWYALDTEGGTDMGSSTCNSATSTSGCPAGTYLPGAGGYSNITFAYIQTLTQLFDSHTPRINWVWWPAASWMGNPDETPCAGTYGALQPAYCPGGTGYQGGVGWGNLLKYVPYNSTSPTPTQAPTQLNLTMSPNPVAVGAILTQTGRLVLSSTGAGVAGMTVAVQYYHDGISWTTAQTLTTDSQGYFSRTTTDSPATTFYYRAVFNGTSAYASSVGPTWTENVGVITPDFAVSASTPAAANIGQSSTVTITITTFNGFIGTVTLVDTVPSGLTCGGISQSSFTTNGTTTVSCSSSSPSTFTLTITGTSGSLTHSTTATFNFEDFSLSAAPSSLSIGTGATATSIISLNPLNGFSSTTTLAAAGPTGVNVSLNSPTVSGSGTSTLTISATTVGSYTVIVTGTSGSLTRTVSLTISVGSQISPVLTAPSAESVVQTTAVTFSVTASTSSVPTPSLTLSASQLPPGASFSTAQGAPPVSGTFTWTPDATIAPGTYTVSFVVNDGISSAQRYVIITVVSASVLPILTVPGPKNATLGASLQFTVSANDPTGTGGPVVLSAAGLASNMVFDPATGAFSFTPTANQAGRTFIVNFTATDSNDPSWSRTESVPIHVQGSSAQPSGGGLCSNCTTIALLLTLGALIGIASSILILHIRARGRLAYARKRIGSLNSQNQNSRVTSKYQREEETGPPKRRRASTAEDD